MELTGLPQAGPTHSRVAAEEGLLWAGDALEQGVSGHMVHQVADHVNAQHVIDHIQRRLHCTSGRSAGFEASLELEENGH